MPELNKRGISVKTTVKAKPAAKTKIKVRKVHHSIYGMAGKAGTQNLVAHFLGLGGMVVVDRVVKGFGMSKGQFAETVGLNREALYKTTRMHARKTQTRIREMLEIVGRVSDWAGGVDQAIAWYRAEPIPAFGDRTAESLVKAGHAGAVRDYLDHLATGGFA